MAALPHSSSQPDVVRWWATLDPGRLALVDRRFGLRLSYGELDALTDRANLPPAVAEHLPPVRQFAASGRINGGFDARLQAEAIDEASANQWRDVVRGIIALARLQSASMPEAQGLLDSIQLGGTDRTITLSFSIPPSVVEWLSRTRNPQLQP